MRHHKGWFFVILVVCFCQTSWGGPPLINQSDSWWKRVNPIQWRPPSTQGITRTGRNAWRTITSPVRATWDATKAAGRATVDFLTPPPPPRPVETVEDFMALPRVQAQP